MLVVGACILNPLDSVRPIRVFALADGSLVERSADGTGTFSWTVHPLRSVASASRPFPGAT